MAFRYRFATPIVLGNAESEKSACVATAIDTDGRAAAGEMDGVLLAPGWGLEFADAFLGCRRIVLKPSFVVLTPNAHAQRPGRAPRAAVRWSVMLGSRP